MKLIFYAGDFMRTTTSWMLNLVEDDVPHRNCVEIFFPTFLTGAVS
jgi:hypothetical protein